MRFHNLTLIAALACAALFSLSAQRMTAQTTGDRIAFNSNRDGSDDLYVMRDDGSDVRQLTNSDETHGNVTWSPDGQTIAFAPYAKGARTSALSTVKLDGAPPQAIVEPKSYLATLVWSPDGRQILYGAQQNDLFGIFAVNADGSNDHAVIPPAQGGTPASGAWLQDGRVLYNYFADDTGTNVLKVADVGGANATTVVDSDNTQTPVVSPDGQYVAFLTLNQTEQYTSWDIEVAKVDGLDLTRITNNDYTDTNVVWSPDSRHFAFVSDRDGNSEIYVSDVTGAQQVNLTQNAASDTLPTWSPDGQRLAFQTDRDGNTEIYVMNADGSNTVNLTNNPANDTFPVWQPDASAVPQRPPVPAVSVLAATEAPTVAAPDEFVTPAPIVTCTLRARGGGNLRAGAGTSFDRAGTLARGQEVTTDGQKNAADGFVWYHLTTGEWVRADLVVPAPECAALEVLTSP